MEDTAVGWLEEEIKDLIPNDIGSQLKFKNKIEQAKEMEKQQIIDFAIWFNYTNTEYLSYKQIIEQYYNETFKQQ
jgi:hypothetical protein